jgi:hypothetical protein
LLTVSLGYIFRILEYFATKLCNFTNISDLFRLSCLDKKLVDSWNHPFPHYKNYFKQERKLLLRVDTIDDCHANLRASLETRSGKSLGTRLSSCIYALGNILIFRARIYFSSIISWPNPSPFSNADIYNHALHTYSFVSALCISSHWFKKIEFIVFNYILFTANSKKVFLGDLKNSQWEHGVCHLITASYMSKCRTHTAKMCWGLGSRKTTFFELAVYFTELQLHKMICGSPQLLNPCLDWVLAYKNLFVLFLWSS